MCIRDSTYAVTRKNLIKDIQPQFKDDAIKAANFSGDVLVSVTTAPPKKAKEEQKYRVTLDKTGIETVTDKDQTYIVDTNYLPQIFFRKANRVYETNLNTFYTLDDKGNVCVATKDYSKKLLLTPVRIKLVSCTHAVNFIVRRQFLV